MSEKNYKKFRATNLMQNIDIEKFTIDWNDRMSLVDLSRKYNLDYAEKATRIALKLGLKKYKKRSFFNEFLNDSQKTRTLLDMYSDKSITILQITHHFGFTDNGYVSKIIKMIGETPRRSGLGNLEKYEKYKNEFIKMWNNEITKKIMAEKFDISYATVAIWRDRIGLEPRTWKGIKNNSIADKIELLLLENSGALTTSEIKKILKIKTIQLGESYASHRFQKLQLVFNMTGKRINSPTSFFGDYTGQTIVYLYEEYDSLILKLSKILQTGNQFKNNQLKNKYNFMILRLSESEKVIKIRERQLYNVTRNKNKQNELELSVSSQLKEYALKQKTNDPNSKTALPNSLVDEILSKMPKSKFFGRKFKSNSIINELDSSYPDQQTRIIQEIFTPFNFICRKLENEYFDLEIKSNKQFFIKLMIHQQINETALKIFQNKLQGKKGIIINFEEISDSVLKTLPENVYIFNKNDLLSLLGKIEFLPINPKSFGKIMFGENKGQIKFYEPALAFL